MASIDAQRGEDPHANGKVAGDEVDGPRVHYSA
jgi:hypothetical protein